MGLAYPDLDEVTRAKMLEEIDLDVQGNRLYLSQRLTDGGRNSWLPALKAAASGGTDDSLAMELRRNAMLRTHETATRKGKPYTKTVPVDAPEALAEGEFNRFYIRALCSRTLASGGSEVLIHRARASMNPRPESEARVGTRISAQALLADLRTHVGVDTALGVPAGVNSGLSVRLTR